MKTNSNKCLSLLKQKCPHCGEGHVYKTRKNLLSLPEMNERCESCQYRFDREPGYFIGAMYASYALAVFEGIMTFLISYFCFASLSALGLALCVVSVILLCSLWNYRMSRVIWMNLFP